MILTIMIWKNLLMTTKPKKLTKTVPPKSGPTPQGLNLQYNTVKTVKLEKINGRHRQSSS